MARESVSEFQQKAAIRDIGHARRVTRETRASRGTARVKAQEARTTETHKTGEYGRRRNKYVTSGAAVRENIKQVAIQRTAAETSIRRESATRQKLDAAQIQIAKSRVIREEQGQEQGRRARNRFLFRQGTRLAGGVGGTFGSNIFKVFVAFFLLSILLLVVSHGSQTGGAIQKAGDAMSKLTTTKPLFKVSA
jgi:hypothetical protein